MEQRISQEEAVRQFKREQLKTAQSLVVWGEYESHRTKDLSDEQVASSVFKTRIFIKFPVRINKLPRYSGAA